MALANLALSPETQLLVPIGLLCTILTVLVGATWRLANYVRDLRDEVRGSWTFRDQERWALQLERENRSRKIPLYVPDVTRAPAEEKREP